MSILSEFNQVVERYPDNVAIDSHDRQVTYVELFRQVNEIRNALGSAASSGEYVATFLEQGYSLAVGALAVMCEGKVFVPIDPLLPEKRIETLFGQLQIGLIVTESKWLGSLATILARCGGDTRILVLDALPPTARFSPKLQIVSLGSIATEFRRDATAIDNPHCYVYFTSGSTGVPKAVLGRTESLLHFIRWESRALPLRQNDRVSFLTAQMFDPFLRDLLLPLLNGASLCIPESRELIYSPLDLLRWFDDKKITITHIIPSMFQVLLEQRVAPVQLRHLRYVVLAGEMLKGALVDKFYSLGIDSAQLINLYGPTETTLAKLCHRVSPSDRNLAVIPVGMPIDDTQAYIVDEEEHVLQDGAVGEVYISTSFMSSGYLNAPAESAACFFTGQSGDLRGKPLYRTGDLGRKLPTGEIELLGRKDFQLKIDGQRVEMGEIEGMLERHPAVKQAVLHFLVSKADEKALIAYVKLRDGGSPVPAELREFLLSYLPRSVVPAHYQFVDSFPLLANGKIDRSALQARLSLRGDNEFIEPETETARLIADIWKGLLHLDKIGINDSFFNFGGTSLQAIKVLGRIAEAFGRTVPFPEFFRKPTIAGLEQFLISNGGRDITVAPSILASGPRNKGALTQDQQRIFFFQHLNPDSCVYNMPYLANWRGPIDSDILACAIHSLAMRHDAFRTGFGLEMGEPVATILDTIDVRLNIVRFDALNGDRRLAAQDWIVADAAKPFVMDAAPLMRAALISVAPGEHLLYINLHHIIGDAWSFDLIWEELLASYARLLDGRECDAAPLPCTLLDFADWQVSQLQSPAFESAKQYWQGQLQGPLPILALPYDKDAPAVSSHQGARCRFLLGQGLSAALKKYAADQSATLYMVLMAAFSAFLHRYSRQSDILIGSPVANRNHPQLEELIGFFVNILVVRSSVDAAGGFERHLDQVKQTILAAFEHRTMPFDRLVELINPERSLGVSPVFQVMFAYQQNLPSARRVGPAQVSTPQQVDNATAKFALTLEMWDEGSALAGSWEYASDRFDHGTIARMTANFEHFLEAIGEAKDTPIGHLPLLAPFERDQIHSWNETDTPFSSESCIHHLIERQASLTPDHLAVVFGNDSISYRELDTRANKLAHLLVEQGVGPEVTVGISVERSIELVVGFLAILKAGGVYVPIDPDYPLERRRFMIEDAGLRLLLSQEKFAEIYRDAGVATVYVETLDSQAAAYPETPPSSGVTADSTAYIIYTSGSTGRPKGVVIRHRGVCNLAEAEIELLAMTPSSRVLQFASFSFDTSIWEIVMTLCSGAALVMTDRLSILPGPDLLARLQQARITHVTLPASALAALPDASLPDLAVLVVAGEACGIDLLKKWGKGRRFVNSYGPTEATVSATNAELGVDEPRIHIGRPLNNTQVWILDDCFQQLPIGVAGELCIGGIGLARGYHGRKDLDAQRFIPNPFNEGSKLYRSGDLARYLPCGNIEYLGRIDRQVKVRGFRIELGEIESLLRGHSSVVDAVAMVRADFLGGSGIITYVLTDQADRFDQSVLQAYLKERLPEFMLPSAWVAMEAFPRLPNNKIDRSRFPLPDLAPCVSAPDEQPGNEVEQLIARVWESILGRGGIGRNMSFFDLGGHSLLAAKSVAILAASHGIELSVREIFEQKTIAGLAMHARQYVPPALSVHVEGDGIPLTHAQQRMWFLEQLEPNAASYNIGVIKEFHGAPRLDLLQRALDKLISRHTVFNTRFHQDHQRCIQSVVEQTAEISHEKLACDTDADWDQALQRRASLEAGTPFNLEGGRLYRLHLVTALPARCALILTVHHLLMDEYSLDILDHDLSAIYAAFHQDRATSLPDLPLSYSNFASWERSKINEDRWLPSLDYWKSILSSAPSGLPLPYDFPRDVDAQQDTKGAVERFTIDDATGVGLMQLAKKYDVTGFMLVLAAFQLLLQRYSGESDICVGVPVSVRPLPELGAVVGLFLNTVVMRSTVQGDCSFVDLLHGVRQTVGDALHHAEVPFDRVVDSVDTRRDAAASSPFQVMLVYKSGRAQDGDSAGLKISNRTVENGSAKFDLTMFVQEEGNGFSGKIEYRCSLFRQETMRRLAGHFQNLLQSLVLTPDAALSPISTLCMLSKTELDLLLTKWNATAAQVPEFFAHQLFEQQVSRVPDATAVVFNGKQFSYTEINQRANRLAHYLIAKGVGPDVLVGLFLQRSDDLIVAVLAVLKAGGAYVPIDSNYPEERLRYVLEDAETPFLITHDPLFHRLAHDFGGVLRLDKMATTLNEYDDLNPAIDIVADQLAYVIYTSGSTGRPKGVMMPHRGLRNYLSHAVRKYVSSDGTGNPVHSSISFDATITSLYLPLITGKTLIVVSEADELEALGRI